MRLVCTLHSRLRTCTAAPHKGYYSLCSIGSCGCDGWGLPQGDEVGGRARISSQRRADLRAARDGEVTIYPEHWLSFAPVGSCNDYISKKLQHQYIYSINDARFFQEWSQVPSLFQDTF
jgi:hypothetical protein